MGIFDFLKPDPNFGIGQNTIQNGIGQNTTQKNSTGFFQKDPDKTLDIFGGNVTSGIAPDPDFRPGMGTDPEYQAEIKAARAKEAAFKASGEEVVKAGPIKEINEALAENKPETMMSKLNSVADKIFNLEETDPESYGKIINGLDIYVRGQNGDTIAEAILGNNKFKKQQASALLQSAIAQNNLAKSQFQVLEAQKKATTPGKVEKGELEIAKNIVKKDVDKDDIDAVANFVAGRAKTIQQNTGMSFNEAITLAYQLAQQEGGGLKNVASLYGKEYVIDPEGSVINVDNYSQEEFDAIPKGTMFIYQGERKIKQ